MLAALWQLMWQAATGVLFALAVFSVFAPVMCGDGTRGYRRW